MRRDPSRADQNGSFARGVPRRSLLAPARLLLLALIVLLASAGSWSGWQLRGSEIEVVGGSEAQRAALGQALEAFEQAGLDLPPLTVRLWEEHGRCGRLRSGHFEATWPRIQIDVCNANVRTVVHRGRKQNGKVKMC